MSKDIYEYKAGEDWYIAKWGSASPMIYHLGAGEEKLTGIRDCLASLSMMTEGQPSFELVVVKKSSDEKLLQFLVEMLNEHLGRTLKLTYFKGLILISEENRVLWTQVAKEELKLSEVLGQAHVLGETLLIATRNEGKTKEFRALFERLGVKVENLNDYPDLPEVAETGMTFEENARLKAETIARLTGQMVLADDSGLKVDLLGGLPGVWSSRFAGPDASDEENNRKLLHELAVIADLKKRSAQFHTTLVVAAPERESLVVSADWTGYIGFQPQGENGFGYDPLFLVGETGKTAAELTAAEKNQQSHRGQAVKKLMEVFPRWQTTL
ncbi:nucleoside-triphosphate diphosphatase [Streptococcus cuniculipharyngis]|uniref:dITP/XTP pyrophosphatase n=1 Tax=Streptococcus cuniculipharyngis TaxID=1562651 RepID=A0A5C5SD91_9STRE|nr:nucleoside-triphosphate diphosphatase [Streptococcus cuniculipharyngis]TWS98140.1 nucleoside-triphosphate diphosphatase [Streptococcus cuniculipharyngis]